MTPDPSLRTPHPSTGSSFAHAALAHLIRREMRLSRIAGLSIAVVDGPRTVWAEGFGFADREAGVKATAETVFKIGSVTKVFTGLALMQLVEQGLINLDDPVQRCLPELEVGSVAGDAAPTAITLRMLASHHSGLPCDNRRHIFAPDPSTPPESFHQAVDYLRGRVPPYPPNRIFNYSNLGLSLLGMIIERASGMAYADYIQSRILSPLGMSRSSLALPLPGMLAKGYQRKRGAWESAIRELPAGAILSTASDMARFIAMLHGRGALDGSRVVGESALATMFERQHPVCPLDFGAEVGVCWMLGRPALADTTKAVWHDGSSQYFFAITAVCPEHEVGVVVLTNSVQAGLSVHRIADIALRAALDAKGVPRGRINPAPAAPAVAASPKPELEAFAGEYPTTTAGLCRLGIDRKGGVLRLQGKRFRLLRQPDGWCALRLLVLGIPVRLAQLDTLRVGFHQIDGEAVLALEQVGFRAALGARWQRVPIPAAWRARAGRYRNIDADDHIIPELQVRASEDLLTADAVLAKLGRLSLALRPDSDASAIIEGHGRYARETVRALEGEAGRPRIELLGLLFERVDE